MRAHQSESVNRMNYEFCVSGSLRQRPGRTRDMFMVMDVKPFTWKWRGVRWPGWLGAQLGRLTFLLDIQEAFHRPLPGWFIVLICRPYPLHQLLHFLLGAHKVVSCLCGKFRVMLSLCYLWSLKIKTHLFFLKEQINKNYH